MGFNSGKNDCLEIARKMAHSSNETNNKIELIVESLEEKYDSYVNISYDFQDLAESIKGKLNKEEQELLEAFVKRIDKLNEHYLKTYSSVLKLSNSQILKTREAFDKYEEMTKWRQDF